MGMWRVDYRYNGILRPNGVTQGSNLKKIDFIHDDMHNDVSLFLCTDTVFLTT